MHISLCSAAEPLLQQTSLCTLEPADYFCLRLEAWDASEYHDICVAFLLHSFPFQSPPLQSQRDNPDGTAQQPSDQAREFCN